MEKSPPVGGGALEAEEEEKKVNAANLERGKERKFTSWFQVVKLSHIYTRVIRHCCKFVNCFYNRFHLQV